MLDAQPLGTMFISHYETSVKVVEGAKREDSWSSRTATESHSALVSSVDLSRVAHYLDSGGEPWWLL